jgi:tRNA A37 N6-isopentenylltransferase MiaA
MATWDEIAANGESLVDSVEVLLASERWDELTTSVWSVDDVPETAITDAQRVRILSLLEVASQLGRDVASRMSTVRRDLDEMPKVRKASTAYLASGTT